MTINDLINLFLIERALLSKESLYLDLTLVWSRRGLARVSLNSICLAYRNHFWNFVADCKFIQSITLQGIKYMYMDH